MIDLLKMLKNLYLFRNYYYSNYYDSEREFENSKALMEDSGLAEGMQY